MLSDTSGKETAPHRYNVPFLHRLLVQTVEARIWSFNLQEAGRKIETKPFRPNDEMR